MPRNRNCLAGQSLGHEGASRQMRNSNTSLEGCSSAALKALQVQTFNPDAESGDVFFNERGRIHNARNIGDYCGEGRGYLRDR